MKLFRFGRTIRLTEEEFRALQDAIGAVLRGVSEQNAAVQESRRQLGAFDRRLGEIERQVGELAHDVRRAASKTG